MLLNIFIQLTRRPGALGPELGRPRKGSLFGGAMAIWSTRAPSAGRSVVIYQHLATACGARFGGAHGNKHGSKLC